MKLHSLLASLLLSQSSPPIPSSSEPRISFNKQWQVLGPFQIGTREAAWGADPLELYGGFHSLAVKESPRFPSSLASNGSVSWSTTSASLTSSDDTMTAELSVGFSDIDWHFQQQVYGWAALQWQAWARGSFSIPPSANDSSTPVTITFQAPPILEYWIDGTHYWGGDFFSFHRAPLVLHLLPGEHVAEIRVVRDVRATGGITDSPDVKVKLELTEHKAERGLLVQHGEALVPDLVFWPGEDEDSARLASEFVEVVVRNNAIQEVVQVYGIEAGDEVVAKSCDISLLTTAPIGIIPGQTRPLNLNVSCHSSLPAKTSNFAVRVIYKTARASHHDRHSLDLNVALGKAQSIYDPHITTHIHPSDIISHALLRPPSQHALQTCFSNYINSSFEHTTPNDTLPILLILHGAGVEVGSSLARESLDELPDLCAWTLWPSGVTAWSSDDWHTFGMRDVLASIHSIPRWLEVHPLPWSSTLSPPSSGRDSKPASTWPAVDVQSWLVAGHSNGGQGTWATLLHYPDNVIAAAPVSGYTSIQNYVPYTFWRPAEAGKVAVVQAALEGWRHELLLPNAKGIPVLQQHGGADDNVPPYHSRLMHQLLPDAGWESEYSEVPEKPHWWDGVMSTRELGKFFEKHLRRYQNERNEKDGGLETRRDSIVAEQSWELVTANPAETGSKHGVKILLLAWPGQLGRVFVDCGKDNGASLSGRYDEKTGQIPMGVEQSGRCEIRTSNVRAFQVPIRLAAANLHPTAARLASILSIDDQEVVIPHTATAASHEDKIMLHRSGTTGEWSIEPPFLPDLPSDTAYSNTAPPAPQRVRWSDQLGGLDAVLRTQGPLHIVTHLPPSSKDVKAAKEMERLALQISRNMQTYFHADSIISHITGSSDAEDEHLSTDVRPCEAAMRASGNIITLALGSALPPSPMEDITEPKGERKYPAYNHAISTLPDGKGLSIKDSAGSTHNYTVPKRCRQSSSCGLGTVFLRPLPPSLSPNSPRSAERVELVVWTCSVSSLEQLARLVPMLTGTGQPDFVILGEEARWKGVQGAQALGWFDEFWEASTDSYFS